LRNSVFIQSCLYENLALPVTTLSSKTILKFIGAGFPSILSMAQCSPVRPPMLNHRHHNNRNATPLRLYTPESRPNTWTAIKSASPRRQAFEYTFKIVLEFEKSKKNQLFPLFAGGLFNRRCLFLPVRRPTIPYIRISYGGNIYRHNCVYTAA